MQFALLPRDLSPETVLEALESRIGAANGMTASELVIAITGRATAAGERRLRQVIETLRCAGHPICAHPSSGYHVAANARELDGTCEYLYSRVATSIKQIAAMKNVAMPDLRGQLRLPLEQDHVDEPHQER